MQFFAQSQKAITESGKDVVLFDDGTWRFTNESDAKTLETIPTNTADFRKNDDATFVIGSSKINVGVYYNSKIWTVKPSRFPNMEYFFTDNKNSYAFLSVEKTKIPNLKTVKELIITTIQNTVDYFRLKESEYRTVNGKQVLYMRYIANIKGMDFEYLGYYFINDNGFAMLVGYASQDDFEEKIPDLQKFLNGFVETDSNVKTETILEYTSPPPPMKKYSK